MITDHLITKATGQYDKEVVTRLRLENLGTNLQLWVTQQHIHLLSITKQCTTGLQRITNLNTCLSLVDLCLSRNEVIGAGFLGPQSSIPFDAVLFTIQIAAISGLEQLVALKRLDLSFNRIRKIGECLVSLCFLQPQYLS